MKKSALIFVLLLLAFAAEGSPARKGVLLIAQPDGSTFQALLRGDEFGSLLTTPEGCAVTKSPNGFYQYAYFDGNGSVSCSGYNAGSKNVPVLVLNESRNVPYRVLSELALQRQSSRPASRIQRMPGTRSGMVKKHCAIILIQFPDVSFQNPGTRRQEFEDLLTLKGYSKNGASGSALDYLNDQFNGSYEFTFTVSGIVTASHELSYYGKNTDDENLSDAHPEELVKEACRLSDSAIDFSQFDDDGDGEVDNVFVIVAGKSEAEGGGSDCIWPHQWYLSDPIVLDGKKICNYAMSTELTLQSQSSGRQTWGMAPIGTFCHEYSHTLGLPDFYDTDYEKSGGTASALWGETSLMDGGCYNNEGMTPPAYNAIERELLGIGKPEQLKLGTFTLGPVNAAGRYLILENPAHKEEFYLFERRAASGWDSYLEASGLAIYHIDMTSRDAGYSDSYKKNLTAYDRWQYNEINCRPDRQCADMVETSSSPLTVLQAFFPYRTVTSFTPKSDPPFLFNDGSDPGLALTNIKLNGESVTFNVVSSSAILPTVTGLTAQVFQDAVILNWESNIEDSRDTAVVSWGETSKSATTVKVLPYKPGKYSLTLEGLTPTTPYSLNLFFRDGSYSGDICSYDLLTKAMQNGKRAYIFLDYLSDSRSGGKFKTGAELPLRVFNAIGEKVTWYFDGSRITADGSGYYPVTKSGTLKAVVSRSDGTTDILVKDITVMQ